MPRKSHIGRRSFPRLAAYAAAAVILAAIAQGAGVLLVPAAAPVLELREAREALAAARGPEVEAWAPDLLAEAQRLHTEALALYGAEQERAPGLRRYDATSRLLLQSAGQARLAMRGAVDRRGDAKWRAEAAVADGTEDVRGAEKVASVVALPLANRVSLSRARMALNEARALLDAGQYAAAHERGRDASRLAAVVRGATAKLAARFGDEESLRTWQSWVNGTIAGSKRSRSHAIIVDKDRGMVSLYKAGRIVKSYEADMGVNNAGRKARAGDKATPEGTYKIIQKKGRGSSKYHKALLLDYPNDMDRRRHEAAVRAGIAQRGTNLGGLIEIHGDGGKGRDWTDGCVALSNGDMDDLFARVGVGTPVTIVGSLGNGGKFSSLSDSLGSTARD